MDVLHSIMTSIAFFDMEPHDDVLAAPVPPLTFCLAELGNNYIVYSDAGDSFGLNTTVMLKIGSTNVAVSYNLTWVDAVSGIAIPGGRLAAGLLHLVPPTRATHWVAVLRGMDSR